MTLQSNYLEYTTPQFRRLSDAQVRRIHHASLEILDRTGVCLFHQEALDLLAKAGVHATDGNRVRIPPSLVEWALSVAPKRVVVTMPRSRSTLRWRETVGWLTFSVVASSPTFCGPSASR